MLYLDLMGYVNIRKCDIWAFVFPCEIKPHSVGASDLASLESGRAQPQERIQVSIRTGWAAQTMQLRCMIVLAMIVLGGAYFWHSPVMVVVVTMMIIVIMMMMMIALQRADEPGRARGLLAQCGMHGGEGCCAH